MDRDPGARNVTPIILGQAVSLLGDYIALLALPLFVLELTGSALDLGLTMASETLPTLLFGFAVGVALDRISLKRALIAADVARMVAFAALAIAAGSGSARPWMAFLVAFLAGSMTVTFDAGFQAWMPSLVGDGKLVTINTRLQFIRTAAWALGPALAGLIVTVGGGFIVAFTVNAVTFGVSALFVLVLTEISPRALSSGGDPWWPAFTEGIRYLRHEARLRAATVAATAGNVLFVPMEALLVLFARDRLGLATGTLIGVFFAGHAVVGALGVTLAPRVIAAIGLGRVFVLGLASLGGGFFALAAMSGAISGLAGPLTAVLASIPAGISVAGVSMMNVAFTT
ncbi:MFS transporter, partial [bacterium]|nr:MFS transporter [bacterium]